MERAVDWSDLDKIDPAKLPKELQSVYYRKQREKAVLK
jgi:hypothetical protein